MNVIFAFIFITEFLGIVHELHLRYDIGCIFFGYDFIWRQFFEHWLQKIIVIFLAGIGLSCFCRIRCHFLENGLQIQKIYNLFKQINQPSCNSIYSSNLLSTFLPFKQSGKTFIIHMFNAIKEALLSKEAYFSRLETIIKNKIKQIAILLIFNKLKPQLFCDSSNKLNLQQQLMKSTTNYYQLKKGRGVKPIKKTNLANSIIYKQINSHLNEAVGKIKNNRQSKETIVVKERRQPKQDEKSIVSKKNSLNRLTKKSSKTDLSNLDIYHIYHKLHDNYMIDTQEETKFQLEDTKQLAFQRQKRESKETAATSSEHFKKSKVNKVTPELLENIKIQKNLFNYLYIIGKGGFGKVWKVEHKKTKNQYAMKEMLKSIVMTKKSVQSVMNERVLLSQFNSPFIVNIHFAFQDRDTLYLVLDLMEGGDLRFHIGNRTFSELQSKFFIACIILGLEDLQNNNIIHRDIKPENLVLDSRGYIRITDLGIARIYKPNNSSDTSGTPGYMSPEVICRMNHSYVSDYFALGVIAYELMTGKRPYNGRSRNEIRDLMLAKEVQLRYNDIPQDWSCEAADFINKLIKRKPQSRLGCNGVQEIKNHPWLDGLNWEKLRLKDIESPFIPMMKKSHFDQDEQITIEDEEQAQLIQKNSLLLRKPEFQELFNSYYYNQLQHKPLETNNADLKDKKNPNKRIISAYRKSSQQQKEIKIYDLMPQKKLSYNQSLVQKKRIDLIPQKNQKSIRPVEAIGDIGVKQKKRSGQYQKNFFR